MLLNHALTELLLAKDYTPLSARRREETLTEFISWVNAQGITTVEEVTKATIRRYMAHLRERPNVRYGGQLSSETQDGRASIVRMFLRFCAREEWLDERVVAHFDMPKHTHKVVQVFSHDHYVRLMQAADENSLPALRTRDKALMALMFDTGVRAMEVCTLRLDAIVISPHES
jgi:integrase/recombinase XerD